MNDKRFSIKKVFSKSMWLILCISLLISSCSGNTVTNEKSEIVQQPIEVEPAQITITVDGINPGVTGVYGKADVTQINWENKSVDSYSAMLVDAIPFLTTQPDLSDLMVYAENKLEPDGSFRFDLPQHPAGEGNLRAMVLVIENQSCLIKGNSFYNCWDAELSSVSFNDASQTQIKKGQLLVWAADDQQTFPRDIGADGQFFTEDDEQETLQFGYTLVDLGSTPFTFEHEGENEIALFSNYDASIRDLSALSYTEAFEEIFNNMKSGYAFNGIRNKEPDWDKVYEKILPLVQEAEEKADVNAWVSALNAYTQEFSDSHIRLQGEAFDEWVKEQTSSGYGFMLTKQTDGNFVISYHDENNPDEVFYEHTDIGEIIDSINLVGVTEHAYKKQPIYGSYSSPAAFEMAQARDFTRAPLDTKSDIRVKRHNDFVWKRNVTAYNDAPTYEEGLKLPVSEEYYPIEHWVSNAEIGYIAIYSNDESPDFLLQELDTILTEFSEQHIKNLIIDIRYYSTETYINLAGYFSEEQQTIAEMSWHSYGMVEGKVREQALKIEPQENTFGFDDIAVMISENCQFACEAEAYALGQLENTTLYGSLPTYGSAAIAEQMPYQLPGGLTFNFPTGSYTNEDGSLFIEGAGVEPEHILDKFFGTIQITHDWQLEMVENDLNFEDELLIEAETPPTPVIVTEDEMVEHLDYFPQRYIRYMAVENYPSYMEGETVEYTVYVTNPDELFVGITYCPFNYIYTQRGKHCADPVITVDGEVMDEEYFIEWDTINYGVDCYNKLMILKDWEPGVHHVNIDVKISIWSVYDKDFWISKGNYTDEFTVVVRESK